MTVLLLTALVSITVVTVKLAKYLQQLLIADLSYSSSYLVLSALNFKDAAQQLARLRQIQIMSADLRLDSVILKRDAMASRLLAHKTPSNQPALLAMMDSTGPILASVIVVLVSVMTRNADSMP